MAPPELVQRARRLLTELARAPRFAGSSAESEARQLCKAELERAGFECRELPFEYSEWPGRWGPPIAAAFQAFTILAVAHMAVHHGALSALAVGAIMLVALMFASTDVKRRWIARLPLERAERSQVLGEMVDKWFAENTFSSAEFADLRRLVETVKDVGAITLVGDRKRERHRKRVLDRHPALRPDNEWRDARELRGRDVEGRPAGAPPSVPQSTRQAVTATRTTP